MHFLLSKFESIGLNKRALTDLDFYKICRRERIRVVEHIPFSTLGWYWKVKNKPQIYLDSKLHGYKKLHVAFHELAHHFLHAASYSNAAFFYCDRTDRPSKEHFEAESFAALALLPTHTFEKILSEEIEDEFLTTILPFRMRLFELYKI